MAQKFSLNNPPKPEDNPPKPEDVKEEARQSYDLNGNISDAQESAWMKYKASPSASAAPTVRETIGYTPDKAQRDYGISNYLNSVFESNEDAEKRERSERQKMGILAVGDALRQMGNLYYTTQGAPSQKLSDPVGDEYNRQLKESTLMSEQRAKAAELLRKQRQQQVEEYYKQLENDRKNQELELKRKDSEDRSKYNDARIEDLKGQAKAREENTARQNRLADHKIENDRQNIQIKRATLAEMMRKNRRNEALQARRIAVSAMRGGRTGSIKSPDGKSKIFFRPDGTAISIPKDNINTGTVATLYEALRKKGKVDGYAEKTEDRIVGIINNIDDPVVQKALSTLGAELEGTFDENGNFTDNSDGIGILDLFNNTAGKWLRGLENRKGEMDKAYNKWNDSLSDEEFNLE